MAQVWGKVLIHDYCRSTGTPSEVFAAYIEQRVYDFHDVEAYGQVILCTLIRLILRTVAYIKKFGVPLTCS
jgi:hypothetical protein